MNSKATMLLVYEHARCFLGKYLILFITLPLTAAWLLLGLYADLNQQNVVSGISGPAYFFIPYLAVAGFRSLFPVAMGMGSTRMQFLKSFYGVGLAGIVFCILVLNLCQYILIMNSHQILHPGMFLFSEFQFFAFLWIDLMVGFFLFGVAFLLYCIWHRLGTTRSLLLLMAIAITGMFLHYGMNTGRWQIQPDVDGFLAVAALGIIGLAALFSTYLLMKDAPVYPLKSTRDNKI